MRYFAALRLPPLSKGAGLTPSPHIPLPVLRGGGYGKIRSFAPRGCAAGRKLGMRGREEEHLPTTAYGRAVSGGWNPALGHRSRLPMHSLTAERFAQPAGLMLMVRSATS